MASKTGEGLLYLKDKKLEQIIQIKVVIKVIILQEEAMIIIILINIFIYYHLFTFLSE